jgi:hypothetical protein
MTNNVFVVTSDKQLAKLRKTAFESEDLLQTFLEEHPALLGLVAEDEELLLVSREQGVPGEEGGRNQWFLDHLYIDRRGVPVLVEVKRASDKGDNPPLVVIGELKLVFNLELVLQGVDRAAVSDEVWLAARISARGKGRERDSRFRNLARRLGFGLLGVLPNGSVEILVSPAAPIPRRDPRRRSLLVEEHRRRQGDPVAGGGSRAPIMTAYRQQALACAHAMARGPLRPRDLKPAMPDAPAILLRNAYGWFCRIERGVYGLTDAGRAALERWPQSAEIESKTGSLEPIAVET